MRSGTQPIATPQNESEAVALAQKGLNALATLIDTSEYTPLRIEHGDEKALNNFERMTIDLDDVLPSRAKHLHAEQGYATYFLLHETLYRLASHYPTADYILWPLCSNPEDDDVYAIFAAFRDTDFFPCLGEDGPMLFVCEEKAA